MDRNRERMSDLDRLTRPILPSCVPNGEDSKLNGWIDVGWEDVTGTLSKLSG